jgi:hypothetical protein
VIALMKGFLEVGADGAAAGNVIVAAQKLTGIAHVFAFIANSALFGHIHDKSCVTEIW